jgi:FKBP-type peptidyl-prolyl cis-trans isomerase
VKLSARRGAALVAATLLAPLALAACGGSSSKGGSASSSSAPGKSTSVGVTVTGGFGDKPTLTVPNKAAPSSLTTDVLTEGTGAAVVSGQSVVVNYLGQTWDLQNGKANVFDNSYDKKQPFATPIGKNAVITGWDKALVGRKAGSRLLLTIPPADAYGTKQSESEPLAGHTLLFVVDLLGSYDGNATAKGTPAGAVPAGFPQVKSASGAVPSVTSVKGVTLDKSPKSALLLKGTGPAIDAKKNFVVQLVQADAKTGKATQSTWGGVGPQVVSGTDLLQAASAFKNATIGSRAVVVGPKPADAKTQGVVLVVDVLGEY